MVRRLMELHSSIDELLNQQKELSEKEKRCIENLKLAAKDTFTTINGKFILKYLFKLCLWNEADNNINSEVLIYKKGRRDIWTILRQIIPKDTLAEIEVHDDTELIN